MRTPSYSCRHCVRRARFTTWTDVARSNDGASSVMESRCDRAVGNAGSNDQKFCQRWNRKNLLLQPGPILGRGGERASFLGNPVAAGKTFRSRCRVSFGATATPMSIDAQRRLGRLSRRVFPRCKSRVLRKAPIDCGFMSGKICRQPGAGSAGAARFSVPNPSGRLLEKRRTRLGTHQWLRNWGNA